MENELQKLFIQYIDQCTYTTKLRSETTRSYTHVFETFIKVMPEIIRPDLITPEAINEFFKRLETRKRVVGKDTIRTGIKVSTVKTYGSKLRVFCKWLVQKGCIRENPFKDIKLTEPEYSDARAMNKDSMEKILAAISSKSPNIFISKRDTAIVYIFIMCGLRRGELIGLQLRDIDDKKEQLTVRGETSKSKAVRTLPINPLAMMYLRDYIRERNERGYKTQFLFVSSLQDRGLSVHGFKHWVERLIRLTGVKFHLHRFRHTFATILDKNNVVISKIQKLMGHKSSKMTASYIRSTSSEDLRLDINKLTIDGLD